MKIDISTIIVNFNTCELLDQCLKTLMVSDPDLHQEIIVIDNNSTDDSVEMVQRDYPSVQLISNATNTGFATANNQGLAVATGEYIFLLNPDTEVFPGCMGKLRELLQTAPNAGAAGPRMFLNRSKTLEVCSLKLLHPGRAVAVFTRLALPLLTRILHETWLIDARMWEATTPVVVEGVGGAGFFIQRDLLQALGGLDERFFMGYEDTDLAAMLRKRGLNIYLHPDAHIVHLFGQAKQTRDAPEDSVYAWHQAPLQYLRKHHGFFATMMLRTTRILDRLTSVFAPKSPVISGHSRSENIRLSWPGSSETGYLFEISNDQPFFDKFGTRVAHPHFEIPSEITHRLPSGQYFWRVFNWPMSEHPNPVYTSGFHIQ